MGETVIFEIEGGVATLTLNRPDKLNAFTTRMHEEIAEAIGIVERDGAIRALLVTGAGRGFCAGQDLSDRRVVAEGGTIDTGGAIERYYNPLVRRIRRLPKPVVCAVNGVAAGAGANLALACDIVVAARSASFIQAFARIGLVPDTGGTWFLPRLVGDARARGLMLLGEKITAEQAEQGGMIWCVFDDATLMEAARALAQRLAEAPTRALGLIKRALDASATNTLDAQLDLERDLQREAGAGEDYKEGVRAFLEKRPAKFTGR
jgi:2-(1,2-epoxy-1,2-dihydrophenyl)acetyl-CoA isomerase